MNMDRKASIGEIFLQFNCKRWLFMQNRVPAMEAKIASQKDSRFKILPSNLKFYRHNIY